MGRDQFGEIMDWEEEILDIVARFSTYQLGKTVKLTNDKLTVETIVC